MVVRIGVGFNRFFLVEKHLRFSEFSLGDIFLIKSFFPLIFYGFSDADCCINGFTAVFRESIFLQALIATSSSDSLASNSILVQLRSV